MERKLGGKMKMMMMVMLMLALLVAECGPEFSLMMVGD